MDEGMRFLLDEILTEQRATRTDVTEIKQTLAEKRGERRVALWLAATVASAVSLVIGYLK